MALPLVSIVIPTFNREKSIIRAINSVLNQTYSNVEVVIVDDCSSDNTSTIIRKEFPNNPKVRYLSLSTNSGACAARNKGIEISKGEYIAFLDSDDEYMKSKIAIQMDEILQSEVDVCVSEFFYVSNNGEKEVVLLSPYEDRENQIKDLLYCNYITTGTIIARRDCFKEVRFDETLPRYQDWDLVIRLMKRYKFGFIRRPLLMQYFQTVSITASTSHKKSLRALNTIFKKNKELYLNNKRLLSQISWLIGLHSLLSEEKTLWDSLWKGAILDGLKIRRIAVIVLGFFGCRNTINRFY